MTSYPPDLSLHGTQLGYCSLDVATVCGGWQDATYSPDGTQLLWNEAGASGTEVITLANSDASYPQTIVSDGFYDSQASFSDNAGKIVYVRQVPGAGGPSGTLMIRDLGNGTTVVVNPHVGGGEPLFTPDAKTILFLRFDTFGFPTGLWSIRSDGLGLKRLVAHVSVFDISPGGRSVTYVAGGGRVFIARANGQHARQIARLPARDLPASAIRFSPDGKLIAVAASSAAGPGLYALKASGGKPRLIFASQDSRDVNVGLSWQPRRP